MTLGSHIGGQSGQDGQEKEGGLLFTSPVEYFEFCATYMCYLFMNK